MATITCMAMAAINVPLIVQDPSRWWNWAAAVFCFGLGITSVVLRAAQRREWGEE